MRAGVWHSAKEPPEKTVTGIVLCVSGHGNAFRSLIYDRKIVMDENNEYNAEKKKWYVRGIGLTGDQKVIAWYVIPECGIGG